MNPSYEGGAGDGNQTHDLMCTKHPLYQLSYPSRERRAGHDCTQPIGGEVRFRAGPGKAIRTPGGVTLNGFQDRLIQPL